MKRLKKELDDLSNSTEFSLGKSSSDEIHVGFRMDVEQCIYTGCSYTIRLEIPSGYPLESPKLFFVTPICHPNIDFKTGEVCLDILKSDWSPSWDLMSVCRAVKLLLCDGNPSSPLNCDAASLLREGDIVGFESLARLYVCDLNLASK